MGRSFTSLGHLGLDLQVQEDVFDLLPQEGRDLFQGLAALYDQGCVHHRHSFHLLSQ